METETVGRLYYIQLSSCGQFAITATAATIPAKKISNHLKKYAADREGAEADNSLRDLQNW